MYRAEDRCINSFIDQSTFVVVRPTAGKDRQCDRSDGPCMPYTTKMVAGAMPGASVHN